MYKEKYGVSYKLVLFKHTKHKRKQPGCKLLRYRGTLSGKQKRHKSKKNQALDQALGLQHTEVNSYYVQQRKPSNTKSP